MKPGDIYPFEFAPKGGRWPWRPLHVTKARVTHIDENGISFEVVGSVEHRRLGVKRWWKRLRTNRP